MKIGQKLRALREGKGWTLEDAGVKFGRSSYWIQRRELGLCHCLAQDLAAYGRVYRLTDAQLVELIEAAG